MASVEESGISKEDLELLERNSYRDELERKAYRDMIRYIKFLVRIHTVRGHWLLNYDDLLAECFLALARAVNRWLYRKPYDQFQTVAKVCIKNAIRDLNQKAFGTHRRAEFGIMSLDAPCGEDGDSQIYDLVDSRVVDPVQIAESDELIAETLLKLDNTEQRVLNALLGGEERVRMYVELSKDRRNWIHKKTTVSVDAYVIARALCEPLDVVREAMTHIGFLLSGEER